MDDDADVFSPMTAYVADMSYFSGKMEAYLRSKEIPYARRLVNSKILLNEVLPATGLMKRACDWHTG